MKYYEENLNGKMSRIVITGILCVAVIFAIVFSLHLYVRITEVKELGEKFLTVFWTNLTVRTVAQTVSFVISFLLFFVSTCVVLRSMKKTNSPALQIIQNIFGRIAVCVVLSVVASTFISSAVYERYLMFANSTSFDLVDPLFGYDISYFVFTRPFLDALVNSLSSVWLVVTIYCFVSYIIIYAVNGFLKSQKFAHDRPVIIHNVVNLVIFFVIQAITYKFRSEEIMYSTFSEFSGAGYTEINIWFNFYRVAPYILMAIVVLSLVLMAKSKYKAMLISVASYPILLILVSLTSVCVQQFVVEPNEAVKELPYLQYNMTYTKLAYNIGGVREVEYPAENALTSDVLVENKNTFDNIRITDFDSTVKAVNSLQNIRNYYKFNDSDVSKYDINGKPALVSIAAREIDKNYLPDSAKNYANEVFRFTHGFGTVVNSLNTVTEEGHPEFLIKDIPTQSADGVPKIVQPRIYYGESTNDYAVVNSTLKEIDYYDGSDEIVNSYDGAGGIKLNFFNRILYALKNADFKLIFSQFVTGESKILINRNVRERVENAVPFLELDNDPYMIIDGNGRLKWIIDCYTTSTYYPYSQSYDGINYIRNSARAVVDAYDGAVKIYVIDENDPIIRTYMKMYPGVFESEKLPEDISEHTVYPEYLFSLQATVYAKYHVSNPNTLYNKSDLWVFAKEKYGNEERSLLPYYNLMDVKEYSGNSDFIIMIPYTLANKDNMVAWLAAGCDAENYGGLVSYHFPKSKNVYGTMQIENRIDSDPEISREMTLWGQGGSNVIRGNMLVVPVGGSLIYIEPIYISSNASADTSNSSIPELKRMIVAYGDKIVMEPTLEEALQVIFAGRAPTGPVGTLNSNEELTPPIVDENEETPNDEVTLDKVIDEIVAGYYGAQGSSAQGDWNGFGENMQALDKAISKLQKFRSSADGDGDE